MPSHTFFRSFGLFTQPEFLSRKECAELRQIADHSKGEEAKVYSDGKHVLHEDYRKTLQAPLTGDAADLLHEKLEALRPQMESCFDLTLGKLYETRCLIYRPGDFFELHIDTISKSEEGFDAISSRQVSVVIFLNDPNDPEQAYTGGVINFHGLMEVPGSNAFGFPLDPEPGLLIAFRSDVLHGVSPVEAGKRYTLVTWFH